MPDDRPEPVAGAATPAEPRTDPEAVAAAERLRRAIEGQAETAGAAG